MGWVRFLMRVLLPSAAMLLRRRSRLSGPLLLLGLGLCLYQTLMLAWDRVRVRSGQRARGREPVQRAAGDEETRRVLSYLEAAQVSSRDVTDPLHVRTKRVAATVTRTRLRHMTSLINKISIISDSI